MKKSTIHIHLGRPNSEPQWAFFLSRAKYTCYGGARGGGKSWAVAVSYTHLDVYKRQIGICA